MQATTVESPPRPPPAARALRPWGRSASPLRRSARVPHLHAARHNMVTPPTGVSEFQAPRLAALTARSEPATRAAPQGHRRPPQAPPPTRRSQPGGCAAPGSVPPAPGPHLRPREREKRGCRNFFQWAAGTAVPSCRASRCVAQGKAATTPRCVMVRSRALPASAPPSGNGEGGDRIAGSANVSLPLSSPVAVLSQPPESLPREKTPVFQNGLGARHRVHKEDGSWALGSCRTSAPQLLTAPSDLSFPEN